MEQSDADYDFYVISNAQWEEKTISELKKRRPGIRCISRNDWIPGKYDLDNLKEPINKCKKVVVGFQSSSSSGNPNYLAQTVVQEMLYNNSIDEGKLIPVKISQDAVIPTYLNVLTPANGWEDNVYDKLLYALETDNMEMIARKIHKNWKKIGKLLGFAEEELNEIERKFLHNPSLEMLRRMKMKRNADDFTTIIDALESSKEQEIPAEILARGPDALKVYQAALEEGESDFNLVRLMVMGQENVGKTCLINSLLGKKFNKRHIITEVIAMTRSLVCDGADNTKWTEKEIDHKEEIKDKQENALATKAAEDLQKLEVISSPENTEPSDDQKRKPQNDGEKSQIHSSNTVGPSDRKRTNSNDEASGNEETKQSKTNTSTSTIGETSHATASASQMEDIAKTQRIDAKMKEKIVQIMKGKSKKDNSLRIWDYGGQLIYHSIHRTLLRRINVETTSNTDVEATTIKRWI